MAYREVMVLEVKDVLRLWLGGTSKKRIARLLDADVKTIRSYIQTAIDLGLKRDDTEQALSEVPGMRCAHVLR